MQACPYDALYLNEDRGTAEKCHYCAHRTEIGLEPACVIVCPVHAIVSGDMSNENSEVATLVREQPTSQRKLEKGTKPRVWYVDALPEALVPGAPAQPPMYLWSDRPTPPPVFPGFGEPVGLTTTLDVGHPPVWGWHIWSYLTTKNVAAGAMIVAPFLGILKRDVAKSVSVLDGYLPEVVALIFITITTALLVHDLGRPERFLKILFHPNPKSWLVKGAWVLTAFGGLISASIAARFFGFDAAADAIRWINLPVAIMASGYTAFLFGQCRGRDLWLERGLFLHLILRAAWLGLGVALMLEPLSRGQSNIASSSFIFFAMCNFIWIVVERFRKPHSDDGRKAHALLTRDRSMTWVKRMLVFSAIIAAMGVYMPFGPMASGALALIVASAGLFVYERAWIKAGQGVPLS